MRSVNEVKKPSAATLREAARMVAEGEEEYSCWAAHLATGADHVAAHTCGSVNNTPAARHYCGLLGVGHLLAGRMGGVVHDIDGKALGRTRPRDHRVIALLFAALAAEDEENESCEA